MTKPAAAEAQNVRASLETTRQALARFSASLRAARFDVAGPQYVRLQAVLLHQRGWAAEGGHRDLDPLWRDVAAEASAIHDLLAPVAQAMAVIRELGHPPAPPPAAAKPAPAPAAKAKKEKTTRAPKAEPAPRRKPARRKEERP